MTNPERHMWKPLCPTAHALQQEEPVQWEAHALQLGRSPCSPQLEKAAMKARNTQNKKINKIKIIFLKKKLSLFWKIVS